MSTLAAIFEDSRPHAFARGQMVLFQGDVVVQMAYVLRGEITLFRPLPDGGQLILQRAVAGDVLAEASAYAAQYHCAAVAQTVAELLVMPLPLFRARLESRPDLAALWAAHLAHAVQNARLRAEIRSLRGVSARLSAWLSTGRTLPPHGQLQTLAAEIGVSREALYRELAKRTQ